MTKQHIYRQGDILFVKVRGFGKRNLKKLKHGIIAEGEATGHMHQIREKTAILYEEVPHVGLQRADHIAPKCIEAFKKTKIDHNEHETVELPRGKYLVVRQRFYSEEENNSFVLYNRIEGMSFVND